MKDATNRIVIVVVVVAPVENGSMYTYLLENACENEELKTFCKNASRRTSWTDTKAQKETFLMSSPWQVVEDAHGTLSVPNSLLSAR